MHLLARYAARCAWCGADLPAGTRIRWYVESHETRCAGRCRPAALEAQRERDRQRLLRFLQTYSTEAGVRWQPDDTDPTRRGSLAWLFWPTVSRLERETRPRAHD